VGVADRLRTARTLGP